MRRTSIRAFDTPAKDFPASPHRVVRTSSPGPATIVLGVKSSVQLVQLVRIVTVAVAGLLLTAGMVLGIRPISTTLTLVSPEVRELTVPCGIGFLPGVPLAGTGETVQLATGQLVARRTYAEYCELAAGWSPYLPWGLTGVGIAGLALLFAGRRDRVGVRRTG